MRHPDIPDFGEHHRVEVGAGRALYAVSWGDPTSQDVAVFDPGSFGSWVDGAHFCRAMAAKGFRAITYSRAGMYPSDPVPDGVLPGPRFHIDDLSRLLTALGVAQPVVLAGHSMAGVRLHFAGFSIRSRIKAMVMIDAVVPELTRSTTWAGWTSFARSLSAVGVQAAISPLAPLMEQFHPNMLDLEGDEREAKVKSIASDAHLEAAGDEIRAMDRKTREDEIDAALHIPALYATCTPVSQGTTKLIGQYETIGTEVRRLKFPKESHMSILTQPVIGEIADTLDDLI